MNEKEFNEICNIELSEEEFCQVCIYRGDCCGGVTSYGNGPVFPPCADKGTIECVDEDLLEEFMEEYNMQYEIQGIWFNTIKGITVIKWKDNTITKVQTQNNELFNKEKGISLCYMKKLLGNTSKYNNILKQYTEEQ